MNGNIQAATWIAAAVLLAACATQSGIVPAGDGMFTVSRQGNAAWVPTAELKDLALKEASDYCSSKQKAFKVLHTKEIPAKPFGGWPEAEGLFSCQDN